jgi:3D (Asp-Asp-Asp) domain-containing protein
LSAALAAVLITAAVFASQPRDNDKSPLDGTVLRAQSPALLPLVHEPESETVSLAAATIAPNQDNLLDAPPVEPVDPAPSGRVMWMRVTAYCACAKCCGKRTGITASGKHVSHNHGRFVAADTSVLPFGTLISIPGYHDGEAVPVIDRGGKIKGHRLDVYFPSHEQALRWGVQRLAVTVVP